MDTKRKIAFVWDNFGPMHVDRCDAVASLFGDRAEIIGIELCGESDTYAWEKPSTKAFRKITLFPGLNASTLPFVKRVWKTIVVCLQWRVKDIFFCHYEHIATLIAAIVLRLAGRRVYVMGCSKFDDLPRSLIREMGKRLFYIPYRGGIGSHRRSTEYMAFLGVPESRIEGGYNSLSLARIRASADIPSRREVQFVERHFTIVARFVPKKNIGIALQAYRIYRDAVDEPHKLRILGSGPLEASLRQTANELGISSHVSFEGFLQAPDVARCLGSSLGLLLPSIEEQFGNVVIEAQAAGVPVILSDNCGARDELVRTGVNGFVVEPDNPEGIAFFMRLISTDAVLWRRMSDASSKYIGRADASCFAQSVQRLVSS